MPLFLINQVADTHRWDMSRAEYWYDICLGTLLAAMMLVPLVIDIVRGPRRRDDQD